MSTANLPTVSVLLDDGSGTFPTDISSYVNFSAGITVGNYGRADWDTQPSPATLDLTLKNDAGQFTTGGGSSFGVGSFGVGPFGGSLIPIAKGQRIRYALTLGATTRTCFTGRIDSLTQTYQGPAGKRSGVSVLAVDALQELGRRPMRSMLEQEVLQRTPSPYYTLEEATGSSSAGDTSGNGGSPLIPTGSGTALTFGTGTGPVDGLSAVQLFGGKYLCRAATATTAATRPTIYGLGIIFATTTAPPSLTSLIYSGQGWSIRMNSSGTLQATGAGGASFVTGTNLCDGAIHTAILECHDGVTLTLWVDGAVAGTAAASTGGVISIDDSLAVGNDSTGVLDTFTGTVSHAAVWPAGLPSGAPAAIQTIVSNSSETTDARLTRLAGYAGLTAATLAGSGQLMPVQATSGASMLDAFQAVADAEGGVLFVNGSGVVTLQGRNYRGQKTTADVTLPGKALDPSSTSIIDDTAQTINQVTVTRLGGAGQTWPTTPASNVFPTSLDLVVDTDANALAHAQWVVAKHSNPAARMGSASTSNMLTSASAAAVLAMEVGNRVALTSMPATTMPNLGTALTVEGWSQTLQIDGGGGSWTWVLNLVPWSFYQVFILDDATYGVLDSATPIGY